jgi:hypothetical protein
MRPQDALISMKFLMLVSEGKNILLPFQKAYRIKNKTSIDKVMIGALQFFYKGE